MMEHSGKLYMASPFFPYMDAMDFYLDNETIPLEVRENMVILSSLPLEDGFLLHLLETMAQEGCEGKLNVALNGAVEKIEELSSDSQMLAMDRMCTTSIIEAVKEGTGRDILPLMDSSKLSDRRDGFGMLVFLTTIYSSKSPTSPRYVARAVYSNVVHGLDDNYSGLDKARASAEQQFLRSMLWGEKREVKSLAHISSTVGEPTSQEFIEFFSAPMELRRAVSKLLKLVEEHPLSIFHHHENITEDKLMGFMDMVEEYNLKWAMASFDWDGGNPSPINSVDYGYGEDQ